MSQLFYSAIDTLGEFSIFFWDVIKSSRRLLYRWGLFIKQCEFIGVSSIGIITVAALFMGGVLGYQLYVSFHLFGAESLLGGTVGVSLFRELAPVMGAIMVTGRAGAAMAAELASMRVSEQIDALEVMAVDPIEFLVMPRVLAGVVMMPLLSVIFGAMGSFVAGVISCGVMGLDQAVFLTQFTKFVNPMEMIHCVVKGAFFGLVLTWVGCFYGYRAYGGARAVGLATRSTVVVSLLSILLTDYLLTSLLPFGFPDLKVTT